MLNFSAQKLIPLVVTLIIGSLPVIGEAESKIKIGIIASLSSFASEYGKACLDGASLGAHVLNNQKDRIELLVEDDGSDPKRTVQAFNKLISVNKVSAVIGCTWWATSLVSIAEKSNTLLISAETLEEKNSPHGKTYFVLQGELRNWVDVYQPIIEERGWKKAAIIHFVSNFGETLRDRLKSLFSEHGRSFVGAIEYSTIDLSDAPTIALKVKQLQPDVLYIDAQPESLPVIMKRLEEIGAGNIAIIANNVLNVALRQKLFSPDGFKELYYASRKSYAPSFIESFKEFHRRSPILNADLGYYAVLLGFHGSQKTDQIAFMHSSPSIEGITFNFNENNVYNGAPQEVVRLK